MMRLSGLVHRIKGETSSRPSKPLPLLSLEQASIALFPMGLVLLLIILSSLAVVYTAFDYRRLFHQYQTLVRQNDQVRIEWGQLLLEQSAWGANNRVEELAAEKLGMRLPASDQVRLVRSE